MVSAIPKYSPTPAACLEVWGWTSLYGKISRVITKDRLGEGEEKADQNAVMAIWAEKFMADQLYRPIVQAYIVNQPYQWLRPGETEIRALINHGIAFLLDTPPQWIPRAVHVHAVWELTEWSKDHPAPEFSLVQYTQEVLAHDPREHQKKR